jgi:GxxExxY protein
MNYYPCYELTDKIINAYYDVYNTLGYGFLEKVYENAMCLELRSVGCRVLQQHRISVKYKNQIVGEYYADLFIDNAVIVEVKAADSLVIEHEYQLINYLKATDIEIGILLNFGLRAKFKRKIYSNKLINGKKSDKNT